MDQHTQVSLERTALAVRERVVRMSVGGGCFVGSALSCVDILVYLYSEYLNVNPSNLDDPARDYLFLSKGHAVPALYGTLAELGFLAPERLAHHLSINDSIYWHPNREIPGVEFHFGSLGHGLAVAIGVALDCRLWGLNNRVVVIAGDGELNEGSTWEALLIARAYRLENLILVIDRNGFQANMRTEDLVPLEPLGKKLSAFGVPATHVDGHSFAALRQALERVPFEPDRPSAIIAATVRGRGVPSIENRADGWFCKYSQEEAASLIRGLHAR